MDEDKQCKRALVCERAPVAVGVKVKVQGGPKKSILKIFCFKCV